MLFLSEAMQKIFRLIELLRVCLDLCLTLRPGEAGYKVFAAPGHRGGPRTKHAQLSKGAAGRGQAYSTLICLSSVRVPLAVLAFLRRRGARVVVNQNGVYYPLWFPHGYKSKNRFLAGLNRLAHHSYFQSEFSEVSYRDWVGPLPEGRSVLYNAVDRAFFRPEPGRRTDPSRLRVLVFLDFRAINSDLWLHLLPLLREPAGCTWVLMGFVEDEALFARLQAELVGANVEWNRNFGQSQVAQALRGCDAALHLVYNDVCPNKVLECLASGVYVICGSAGGSRELVRRGGGEVLEVQGGYERKSYPALADLRAAIERFRSRADELRAEAARCAEAFDLEPWIRAMTGERR